MKKLFAITLIFLLAGTFLQAQDLLELKKKVQSINDEYAKQMVGGDMDALWGYYADDIISMPSYEPMLKGLDAVKESSKKMEESGSKITAFSTASTDLMKSGNFVIDIGTYTITMELQGMDMPWNDYGKYLNVWEVSDDGSMKLKVETWNTDVNPWEEMQKAGESHEEEMGKPEKKQLEEKE